MPGHRPGVSVTPGRPVGFQKLSVIFSDVPFLLPIFVKSVIWLNLRGSVVEPKEHPKPVDPVVGDPVRQDNDKI